MSSPPSPWLMVSTEAPAAEHQLRKEGAADLEWSSFATDDIDEATHFEGSNDYEITQLTGGPLGLKCEGVRMPGLTISFYASEQRVAAKERHCRPSQAIAYTFDSEDPPLWRGRPVSQQDILLYGSEEVHEYVVARDHRSLVMEFSEELAESMGWPADQFGLRSVCPNFLRVLLHESRRIVRLGRHSEASDTERSPSALALRDEFLRRCFRIAPTNKEPSEAHFDQNQINAYQIVTRAEKVISSLEWHDTPNVNELARRLGVSRRTLFRAFESWVGMGPSQYFTLLRLHRFRERITAPNCQKIRLSDAALDSGFEHFGRLAKLYQGHFGELPRETRKRTSDSSKAGRSSNQ